MLAAQVNYMLGCNSHEGACMAFGMAALLKHDISDFPLDVAKVNNKPFDLLTLINGNVTKLCSKKRTITMKPRSPYITLR